MATYSVHRKIESPPDDVILVPEGFNPRAFIFTVLWALWHRMWVVAAVVLAILVSVTLLGLAPEVVGLLQIGLSLLFGFEANDLHRMALTRAGYREVALVGGSSLVEAELRYFASRSAGPGSATAHAAPIRYDHDTLGLFGNV